MKRQNLKVVVAIGFFLSAYCSASAQDKNMLFPETLKIPLIGPSKPAPICMSEDSSLKLQNTLSAKVEYDCVRLSVKAVDEYDDANDVFLLLAYANILHDRGWKTTDMVSGTPLLKSPNSDNGCTRHMMLTGGFLDDYFPDEVFSEDDGQYLFLSFFLNEEGEICGESKLEPTE